MKRPTILLAAMVSLSGIVDQPYQRTWRIDPSGEPVCLRHSAPFMPLAPDEMAAYDRLFRVSCDLPGSYMSAAESCRMVMKDIPFGLRACPPPMEPKK